MSGGAVTTSLWWNGTEGQFGGIAELTPEAAADVVKRDLDAARNHIASLENSLWHRAKQVEQLEYELRRTGTDALQAARMHLADECGSLRNENRDLLAENARLRRRVERLELQATKRKP